MGRGRAERWIWVLDLAVLSFLLLPRGLLRCLRFGTLWTVCIDIRDWGYECCIVWFIPFPTWVKGTHNLHEYKGGLVRLESIRMCKPLLQGPRRLIQHVYQQLYEAVYNPANASLADTDDTPVLPRSGANGHSLRCVIYPVLLCPGPGKIRPAGRRLKTSDMNQ